MRAASLVAIICLSATCQAAVPDVCTNGSFEELDGRGFPVHWQAVGTTVEVCSDAHSGQRALRVGEHRDRPKRQRANLRSVPGFGLNERLQLLMFPSPGALGGGGNTHQGLTPLASAPVKAID